MPSFARTHWTIDDTSQQMCTRLITMVGRLRAMSAAGWCTQLPPALGKASWLTTRPFSSPWSRCTRSCLLPETSYQMMTSKRSRWSFRSFSALARTRPQTAAPKPTEAARLGYPCPGILHEPAVHPSILRRAGRGGLSQAVLPPLRHIPEPG